MNFTTSLRTLTLALVLSIGVSYAYATWAPPTATPPLGNIDVPVNVGDNTQYKAGNLVLNNSATPFANGLIVWAGNVGVGTANPGNYSINVEKTGDASLKLVADTDNNNDGDNPLILMTQDAGGNAFLIGMTGAPGTDPLDSLYTDTTRNAMFVGDPGGGGVTGDLQFGTNDAVRMTIDGDVGNVGIGVASPVTKLDVAGAVKVGDFLPCGAAQAGAIRYNSGTFQGCNGGSWIALSGGVSYTPGSQTWATVGPIPPFTVPIGVTFMKVTMAGGGGGGAGGNNTVGTGSGGGGGGGYSEYVMTGVTQGQIINGYVGAGGSPGGYSSAGSDGENTTFGSLVATSGKGGPYDLGANEVDVGGAGGSPGGLQGGSEGSGVGGNSGAGQGLGGAMGSPGEIYGGGGGGGAVSSSPSPKSGAQGWIKVEW